MPARRIDTRRHGHEPISVYSLFAYAIVAYAVANPQRLTVLQTISALTQLDDITQTMLNSLQIRVHRTSLTTTTTPGSHLREARLPIAIVLRQLRSGRRNHISLRRVAPN